MHYVETLLIARRCARLCERRAHVIGRPFSVAFLRESHTVIITIRIYPKKAHHHATLVQKKQMKKKEKQEEEQATRVAHRITNRVQCV